MLRTVICSIFTLSTMAAATAFAEDRDDDRSRRGHLKGEYAFTGTAACLVAPVGGFDSALHPLPLGATGGVLNSRAYHFSFSVEGIRKFNGDGTGTLRGTAVGITPPPTPPPPGTPSFPPSAFSQEFSASFTYTVLPDRTFTTEIVPGSFTGTFLAGPRAGQTFTVDKLSLTGLISVNKQTLTLASVEPTIETSTIFDPAGPVVQQRICHRARVLVRMDN